jgi:branched-chain amino acid transport system permease protein
VLDHLIDGLALGNIYALIAIGFALIFGVANLINFAHGSVFAWGAYIGWTMIAVFGLPWYFALVVSAVGCGLIGVAIERLALRPLAGGPPIAPLLSTVALSVILDQAIERLWTPDPRSLPAQVPSIVFNLGGVRIGLPDLLIAGIGLTSALVLWLFLTRTKLGWAVRATAQDRDAALQMGVDVDRIQSVTFGIASALGGVAGLLVGIYYNNVYPSMGFQAGLSGFTAAMLGGLTSVPGAVVGGLLLGVGESFGAATLGNTYRQMISFVVLILVLMFRPSGLFGERSALSMDPGFGGFFAAGRVFQIRPRYLIGIVVVALLLPLVLDDPVLYRVATVALIFAILALSLTLVAGQAGQVSLGHAGFFGIGAYVSAILTTRTDLSPWVGLPLAALVAGLVGAIITYPALRVRGHYVAIATLGIGQIVAFTLLNWESLTNGAMGILRIPPISLFGYDIVRPSDFYWLALVISVGVALLLWQLSRSHLGRSWRAIREDETAALTVSIRADHYKVLAFGLSAAIAGLGGALIAHFYGYISYDSFLARESILALTMVVLGGMSSIPGAFVGSLALIGLPELLRQIVPYEYRYLLYGILLLLVIRFRPRGLIGGP